MTDVSADIVAGAETPAAELQPFERWLEAARPKAELWRMVIGVIIVLAIWTMWTAAALFTYALSAALWGDVPSAQIAVEQLVNGSTPLAAMTLLLSFLGLWLGVWLAARLMHGQRFATVISPEGRVRRREFFLGVGIIAGYFAISLTLSYAAGLPMGRRSELSVIEWATLVVPVCVLVFFQASGEELLFRGYLTQQLGARFRHPLIWGLLPSLVFGAIHYSNGTFFEYSAYYVVATTLFAFAAVISVWRTGSLSMAMGMHTANNIASFLLVGSDENMSSTQLWLWSTEDAMKAAPYDIVAMILLVIFMASSSAPLPKRQLRAFRKDTRAAP